MLTFFNGLTVFSHFGFFVFKIFVKIWLHIYDEQPKNITNKRGNNKTQKQTSERINKQRKTKKTNKKQTTKQALSFVFFCSMQWLEYCVLPNDTHKKITSKHSREPTQTKSNMKTITHTNKQS